ncbi:hypothetical protein N0V90_007608 [Kalmusia sp. IMI 367209]|nr:hypothetical protein N0V90_007608 [Kalmusia sp. IMI 367209]
MSDENERHLTIDRTYLQAPLPQYMESATEESRVVRDGGLSLEFSERNDDRSRVDPDELVAIGAHFDDAETLASTDRDLLDFQIRKRRIAEGRNGQLFLPGNELGHLINLSNIIKELKIAERQRETGKRDVGSIALQIWNPITTRKSEASRQRIFAILCLLREAAEIVSFIEEGIYDHDLPFIFKADPSDDVYRKVDFESTEKPILLFRSKLWIPSLRESFDMYQWQMLAPVFNLSYDYDQKVLHYDLKDQTILPFMKDNFEDNDIGVSQTLWSEGGLSFVRRVKIHQAHFNTHLYSRIYREGCFAVKELKVLTSPSKAKREAEALSLKRLNDKDHEHLTKLYATYMHKGRYHMIFPWADGNLNQLWEKLPHDIYRPKRDPEFGFTDTYKAPESDINKHVSSSYDIWSFGCILLQFAEWYLLGWEGVKEFSEARKLEAREKLYPEDKFYEVEYNNETKLFDAHMRTSVVEHDRATDSGLFEIIRKPSLLNSRKEDYHLPTARNVGLLSDVRNEIEDDSETKARNRTYRLGHYPEELSEKTGNDEYEDGGHIKDKDIVENEYNAGDGDNEDDEESQNAEEGLDEETEVSSQAVKSNLNISVNSPTTIAEAVSSHDINGLRRLLKNRFKVASQDEYSWLREMEDIGYTHDEIADLLWEQATDSPWIYFVPDTISIVDVKPGIHLPGCLCGLAGITPISRNLKEWNGFVKFENQNTTAITYDAEQQEKTGPLVEICRIHFELALQMSSELESLTKLPDIRPADTLKIQELASQLFQPFMPEATDFAYTYDVSAALQSCSLAVQLISLGFLSYSQAHVAAILPFFLDTPLQKIHLLGSRTPSEDYDGIEASLNNLTCIGDMIQAPVLTFKLVQSQVHSLPARKPPGFDLLTNAQDLLDTWGPGHIVQMGTNKLVSAIKLGDGFVFASNTENTKFHWSRRVSPQDLSRGTLDPRKKIVIGMSVTVNGDWRIDGQKCWVSSSAFLEPLGPYGIHWERDEKQLGFQFGNYALVQAVAASHKLPGQTLKQHRLQQDDEALIPFLDNIWGVQVSFCTRVARRVPLREMVVDMLPLFITTFVSSQNDEKSWKELQTTYNIMGAFQEKGIRDWLITLPPELHQHVLRMVRRIFDVLKHTGLDRNGKHLLVAWPRKHEIFRCFKVPCKRGNSWAGILADSEDCATFAYVSTQCFETKNIKCSGPEPTWQDAIPLLETAVVLHSTSLTSALQHNATYFFQKLNSLFFVKVQRPNATSTAKLVTFRSIIPMDIQRRMLVTLMEDRKRLARLREKIAPDDLAEQVVVSRQGYSIG